MGLDSDRTTLTWYLVRGGLGWRGGLEEGITVTQAEDDTGQVRVVEVK